ncbi:MAG: hypothetical protein KKC84_02970 [Candidatus Omnitrophica bacterium]|nr:hypothetical protein [Candidatus Omnitrophota bacterium]
MEKKYLLILLVSMIVLSSGVCMAQGVLKSTEEIDATEQEAAAAKSREIEYIYGAISEDGRKFTVLPEYLCRSGALPDVVELTRNSTVDKKGTLLLYFVDPRRLNVEGEGMMLATSSDGFDWSAPCRLVFSERQNKGVIVDPSVIELPNGDVRMYFYGAESADPDQKRGIGENKIYSAVSADGVRFRVEPGVRFEAFGVRGPEVVYRNGEWFMFLSRGQETILARSPDGMSFRREAVFSLITGWQPGAVVLPNNKIRIFITTHAGIKSILYNPGTTMMPEYGERIQAESGKVIGEPSCIRRPDGSYFLVFKKKP